MRHEFRLPRKVVYHQFGYAVGILSVGLLLAFFRPGSTIKSMFGTVGVVSFILLVCFSYAITNVWVSISPLGVSGTGPLGRNNCIEWQESVLIVQTKKYGMQGIEIKLPSTDSVLRLKLHGIFIPKPIFNTQSFIAILRKYAPETHPLRTYVESAI